MSLKFNIDRPKISDEEIKKHQDFDKLVKQFKEQSLKQAQGDESWRKNKSIRYSAVIAGITVICTVTYFSLFKKEKQQTQKQHETLITQKTPADKTSQTQQQKTTSTQTTPAKQASKSFIKPPSQTLKINYSSYRVNNAAGGTIAHTTSSKINIPKNSFVDKSGKDIVGDVTIEYREFHDAGDVIVSGIPMAYDSAGIKYNLETAGMFDIRGSQNGSPVFIKPDKTLAVELASRNSENRFNQYYLDTVKKNWQCMKRDQALPVSSKQKAREIFSGSEPARSPIQNPEAAIAKDQKLSALKKQIDVVIPKKIDSVKVVYQAKADKLPRPKAPAKPEKASGRPTFQLESSAEEFPELQAFKNAVFEVGTENKNYSKELHDITWSSVNVSQGPAKGKNYLLTLTYRNRQEQLVVYPVLTGADYEKAKAGYDARLEEYQRLFEKRQADEKRLLAEMETKQAAYMADLKKKQDEYKAERAKLLARYNIEEQNELASNFNALSNQARATRIFNVARFGIYNSDCPRSLPQGASFSPMFVSGSSKAVYPETIYLVDHDLKTVYNLRREEGFMMSFTPGNAYSICLFSGGKLFLCGKDAFKQTVGDQTYRFPVIPLPDTADNLADFKKALEI